MKGTMKKWLVVGLSVAMLATSSGVSELVTFADVPKDILQNEIYDSSSYNLENISKATSSNAFNVYDELDNATSSNVEKKEPNGISKLTYASKVAKNTTNISSTDILLNPDTLRKIKNKTYNPSELENGGYYESFGNIFSGVDSDGCTLDDILKCLEIYNIEFKQYLTEDTEGILIYNFYFGTSEWALPSNTPDFPERAYFLMNQMNGSPEYSNLSPQEREKILQDYYQTDEWIQYVNDYKQSVREERIYPDTKCQVICYSTLYLSKKNSDDYFPDDYLEIHFDDYDEYEEKQISIADTDDFIKMIEEVNNEINGTPSEEPSKPSDDPETTMYTATFNSNGGNSISDYWFKPGTKIQKPNDPIKSGYKFTGWYIDEECTKIFEFSSLVYNDVTLFAGWKKYTSNGTSSNSSSNYSSSSNSSDSGNGLKYEGNNFFYYKNGNKVKNSWENFNYDGNIVKRYFDENGKMKLGFDTVDGKYYYFQEKLGISCGSPVSIDEFVNSLNTYSPSEKFRSYSNMGKFINNVDVFTELGYSLSSAKDTMTAMWTSLSKGDRILSEGYWETVAKEFMNNPDKCRVQLRELINELSETEEQDFLSGTEDKYIDLLFEFTKEYISSHYELSKEQSDLVKSAFSDAKQLKSNMKNIIKNGEALTKQSNDYNRNLSILESLRKAVPDGTEFAKIIDDTIWEYKNAVVAQLFENANVSIGSENVYDLIKPSEIIDKVTGLKFDTTFKIIDLALENVETVNAIEDIVYGNIIVSGSNFALRDAEQKVKEIAQTGNKDELINAIIDYSNVFEVAKSAKISEYEKMLDYYNYRVNLINSKDQ